MRRGPSNFSLQFVGVTISVEQVLNYGFLLPSGHYIGQPCSWKIRLQLSVASFQWDYGPKDGLASPLQMRIAVRLVPVVCPDSRIPPRGPLWKTDPKRPLLDLSRRLAESIGGILLKQSGGMPCPSTDASLPVLVRDTVLTAFFWMSGLGLYEELRWMHVCPVGWV